MSKKTAITIVIIFLLAAAFFAYWFLFMNGGNGTSIGTGDNNNLFPFGQNGTTNNTGVDNENNTGATSSTSNLNEDIVILRQISSTPVAGATIFKSGNRNLVRYIERGTGHIYETTTDQNALNTRISNKTIPKIYEAYFANSGKDLILRYLKEGTETIETFHAKIRVSTSTDGTASLDGSFLAPNIDNISVLENSDKLFSLAQTSTGAVGIISKTDGTSKNQIFNSFLNYWLTEWPRESTLALTTKPASGEDGFLYYLNTQTGTQTKVLGPVKGLTTLVSPDTTKVLYTESIAQSFKTYVYDVVKNQARTFDAKTLPEKCVWSKNDKETLYCAIPTNIPFANYPEDRYQGLVSLNDNIWKININTGSTKLLANLSTLSGKSLDAVNIKISDGGEYLLFENKNDLTLWGLDLLQIQKNN